MAESLRTFKGLANERRDRAGPIWKQFGCSQAPLYAPSAKESIKHSPQPIPIMRRRLQILIYRRKAI